MFIWSIVPPSAEKQKFQYLYLAYHLELNCHKCNRYHVPRSWFKPSGNVLVIFEEKGADPTKIKISKRKTSTICSSVAEDYPSMDIESWITEGDPSTKDRGAEVHLKCPENTKIHAVNFASFGNPAGSCGSYSLGSCHDPASMSVVVKVRVALGII